MKKRLSLREIVDACLGLGAAGMLLGVTAYYCLPILEKRVPSYNHERIKQEDSHKSSEAQWEDQLQLVPQYAGPRDELWLPYPRPLQFDGPRESHPSDRKEK